MPQCAAHISSFLTDMPKFSAARRIEGWLLCWVPLWELPSVEENHLARGHSPSSGASQIHTVHVLPTTYLPCPNVNGHPSFMGSAEDFVQIVLRFSSALPLPDSVSLFHRHGSPGHSPMNFLHVNPRKAGSRKPGSQLGFVAWSRWDPDTSYARV